MFIVFKLFFAVVVATYVHMAIWGVKLISLLALKSKVFLEWKGKKFIAECKIKVNQKRNGTRPKKDFMISIVLCIQGDLERRERGKMNKIHEEMIKILNCCKS